MKKVVLSVVAALAFAAPAFAADMPVKTKAVAPAPSPWDIAFGGAVMSDYNFRGISQSNKGASGGAYFEPQYTTAFGTLYVGVAGWGIDWPSGPTYGFTAPSAEIDLYGGWRKSWGPVSLDLGIIDYYYPKETFNGATSNSDFYEFYAKAGYDFGKGLSVGANVFYTPDLLNYSESFASVGVSKKASATYGSLTGKWVLPWTSGDLGAYLSGELGHWWIDSAGFTAFGVAAGIPTIGDPSYTYYNAGLAFTYKAFTLDLRYHGNDLGSVGCNSFLIVAPGNASSNWCDKTFVVAFKVDSSLSALK